MDDKLVVEAKDIALTAGELIDFLNKMPRDTKLGYGHNGYNDCWVEDSMAGCEVYEVDKDNYHYLRFW